MNSAKPKVLMEVAFEPMLDWVLAALRGAGIAPENTAVIIGARAELLQKHLSKSHGGVQTFVQSERKGTGHAVMQAEAFLRERVGANVAGSIGGSVAVLCGDAPFMDADTIAMAYEQHRSGDYGATVITAELDNPANYGRIIRTGNGANTITHIVEEKDCTEEQRAIREINSGAYWFNCGGLLETLPKLTTANKSGEYYLTDTIGLLHSVSAYKAADSRIVLGANNRRDLRGLNAIAFEESINKHSDNGVEIIGDCYIARNAVIGRDTTLLPGTVIRPDVVIGEDCKIGPFAHLRPGTRLADGVKIGDFVELKSANIGEKTSVAHLSYIGDADVGSGVNFGCGCVTANYDGVNKYRTTIGDNAFIGCNTNLIAPVTIGENAMTAAGSTINREVPANALAIERTPLRIKENWKLNDDRANKRK